ncbi:MAG TPA: tRNA epoxyqueuosine(34) reductase QueG [Candidatus Eisenbacteria bacterium]
MSPAPRSPGTGAPPSPAARIKARALELGFDAVGIAGVAPLEARAHFEAWLAAGHHGTMAWLATERSRARRADPARILPGVASVVCVALCHEPAGDPARDRRLGRIARYAVGEDYHRIMRDKLTLLERFIEREALPGSRALWYSDTGAILERGFAERAGIGWAGKHSGVLSRERGSYFLLGEVLVDRALEPDPPAAEHCGSCTRCIEACPTGAIVAPGQVDARRCISYLTIEHRGAIPLELRPLVGDWIFGCDVCQEVCPWNRFAPPAREARLHARSLEGWTLAKFLALDDDAFMQLFAGSPIRRARRGGFLRNVCVALGNRREAAAVPALARALAADPEPLVRAHAAWALGEIGTALGAESAECSVEEIATTLARACPADAAAEVREEAERALERLGP